MFLLIKNRPWSQTAWVQIPPLSLTECETPEELLNHSLSWFSPLSPGMMTMPPIPQGLRINLSDASEALGILSRTFEQRHREVKSLACAIKAKGLSWDLNPCSHHCQKEGCGRSGKVMKTRNHELMRAEPAHRPRGHGSVRHPPHCRVGWLEGWDLAVWLPEAMRACSSALHGGEDRSVKLEWRKAGW